MSDAERVKLIDAALKQATTAGKEEDRRAIAATLRDNHADPATWFAGIVPDATFLGRQIRASDGEVPGVHRALFDALKRAERTLLDNHPGRTAEQLGNDLGIRDIGGLRPPKKATGRTGREQPSLHCFGLAIDINSDTNPFVGLKMPNRKTYKKKFKKDMTDEQYKEFMANRSPRIIGRAMRLLHGERFNVESDFKTASGKLVSESGAGAAWDIHHRASETLAEYLRLADDVESQRVQKLVADARSHGEPESLAWWKNRITTDRSVLKHWDFPRHPDPWKRGYMDLPRELVVALVEAGLRWGGQFRSAKDIMHFDLPSFRSDRARQTAAERLHRELHWTAA
jgi:D-alanyl-D-alanine carboxypeptidase